MSMEEAEDRKNVPVEFLQLATNAIAAAVVLFFCFFVKTDATVTVLSLMIALFIAVILSTVANWLSLQLAFCPENWNNAAPTSSSDQNQGEKEGLLHKRSQANVIDSNAMFAFREFQY